MDNTPAKISYGNSDINEVMSAFTEFTGMKLTNIKRQRMFAKHIINAHGVKDCVEMIKVVAYTMPDRYAPRIPDIEKLYWKWNDLVLYAGKKSAETKVTKVDLTNL